MGGSSSKPATIGTPLINTPPVGLDLSKVTVTGDYAQQLADQANQAAAAAQQQLTDLAAQATAAASSSSWTIFWFKVGAIIVGLIVLVIAGIAIYDAIACQYNGRQILFLIPGPCNTAPAPPPPPPPPPASGNDKASAPVPQVSSVTSPRTVFQDWYYGAASGNIIGDFMHDSTSSKSIASTLAPLPSEGSGAYGIQWWMFVKDWNYGYGKEKVILSRPDPSNVAIENPKVSLAATENNLRVSISLFPADANNSSKSEPAAANDSSSTDDVFVCEVPNIPLQSWFSVSLTVFDRNVDIYINGNLVKSCLLPGVPKPAAGNIDVSKDGGFSGYMCDLNHYGKALVPSDAQSFFTAGTRCSGQSGSAGASGGYTVKFGVYDTKGKEIKDYTF